MIGGIYTIRIKNSEKLYIGRTVSFAKRKSHHIWLLRLNKHHCKHLQNSFNKHEEVIFKEEQEENNKEKRIILEQEWLDKYKGSGLLVNHQLKATNNDVCGMIYDKSKKRIPHNKGKASPTKGIKRDPSIGKKISATKRSKPATSAQIKAWSENGKKTIGKINHISRPISEETRKKISAAQLGKKRPPYPKSHGEAISKARKGMVFSDEHKEKLSHAARNRKSQR